MFAMAAAVFSAIVWLAAQCSRLVVALPSGGGQNHLRAWSGRFAAAPWVGELPLASAS
eukprot:CAMPEP_0183442844 /NCGR_PEP_ID=MMETSP0370-20130417/89681_1 /TAXON_ID=268820 /ORGANISM="Peridinium aciculiferum, Strain PAER-2" /LENGTH=57 /DNA_ID=CAMNT_0025632623 /DNA_START=182 /DNA_END=355 /DNA_ORIENTATION=-